MSRLARLAGNGYDWPQSSGARSIPKRAPGRINQTTIAGRPGPMVAQEGIMRRFLSSIFFLAILAGLVFYVAWPAWSAYSIYQALNANDSATLASKIDFPSVRESLKPIVAKEVDKALADAAKGAGGGLLNPALQKQIAPKVVDTVLTQMVTPQAIGTLYSKGGDMKDVIGGALGPAIGKLGGLTAGGTSTSTGSLGTLGGLVAGALGTKTSTTTSGSSATTTSTTATSSGQPGAAPSYGLGNVKQFSFSGPLGFELGVAKDPAATKADVVAGMSFKDMDWKLTSLTLGQ